MATKRKPGEMRLVNDLIDEFDDSRAVSHVWGGALLRYLNTHCGEDHPFLMDTTVNEIHLILKEMDQKKQFLLLSRPIEEGDPYTGEIWRALESSTTSEMQSVQQHNVVLSRVVIIGVAFALFVASMLVTIRLVHNGFDVTGFITKLLDMMDSK